MGFSGEITSSLLTSLTRSWTAGVASCVSLNPPGKDFLFLTLLAATAHASKQTKRKAAFLDTMGAMVERGVLCCETIRCGDFSGPEICFVFVQLMCGWWRPFIHRRGAYDSLKSPSSLYRPPSNPSTLHIPHPQKKKKKKTCANPRAQKT